MPDKRTALQLRHNVCLKIAEAIFDYAEVNLTEYDLDYAADLADTHLPYTYDEYLEEFSENKKSIKAEKGPVRSIVDDLRSALGLMNNPEIGLRELIQAAIDRIKEQQT